MPFRPCCFKSPTGNFAGEAKLESEESPRDCSGPDDPLAAADVAFEEDCDLAAASVVYTSWYHNRGGIPTADNLCKRKPFGRPWLPDLVLRRGELAPSQLELNRYAV